MQINRTVGSNNLSSFICRLLTVPSPFLAVMDPSSDDEGLAVQLGGSEMVPKARKVIQALCFDIALTCIFIRHFSGRGSQ